MSEPAVTLDRVHKDYGPVHALDGLTLGVRAGEVLGLLGHNGAGKTTTIMLALGVIAPSRGQVRVLGGSPIGKGARRLRRLIGYLPESASFYGQLTGREVLEYFARLKGVRAREAQGLLLTVGLAAEADRRVKSYSKGMCQRLALAQALLGRPRLLLLDEPTAGLDPLATQELFQIIDELRRKGSTVVLSSHVLSGIEAHIDRAAILAGGRLRAVGTLESLRRQAGLPLVIRARGSWQPRAWEKRLQRSGVQGYRVNGTQVEVLSPLDQKLPVIRALLEEAGVDDIELLPPTLESLYAHFNDARGGG